MSTQEQGETQSPPPEHRSFRLAGGWRVEGIVPKLSWSGLIGLQIGMSFFWFLGWGMILCCGAERVAMWLPLNYLLFDLYLLARGGLGGGSAARSSRWAVGFIRLSPLIMIPSAFVLGMVGTGLSGAMDGGGGGR